MDFIWAFILIYVPTLIVCGAAFFWSRRTSMGWLQTLLRRSAIFWATALFIGLFTSVLGASLCDGSILYGYSNCTFVSAGFSQIAGYITLIGYQVAIFYAVILFTAGGLVEMLRPTPGD